MISHALFRHSQLFNSYGYFFRKLLSSFLLVIGLTAGFLQSAAAFDFTEELFGEPGTLGAWVVSIDNDTGEVTINDSPLTPISRPYPGYPAPALSYFDDSFFNVVPRSSIEYVLINNYSAYGIEEALALEIELSAPR